MFTAENTQGFTTAQIADLNTALAQLQRDEPDVDEKIHSDRLNNAWVAGITVNELTEAARVAASRDTFGIAMEDAAPQNLTDAQLLAKAAGLTAYLDEPGYADPDSGPTYTFHARGIDA